MSILMELTIGIKTAWWFSVIYLLGMIIVMIYYPKESWVRFFGGSESEFTKNDTKTHRRIKKGISYICWFGLIIYAVFVPVQWGTIHFYFGLGIFAISMLLYVIALFNYASTPVGQPVTKGLYKISRNPQYVFDYLIWVGIGILTASWVIILVKTFGIILEHYTIIEEEHFCLEKYGKDYEEYLQKIPRYL